MSLLEAPHAVWLVVEMKLYLLWTTFVSRYVRFFVRYVASLHGLAARNGFLSLAESCSKKRAEIEIPFYKSVETDNFRF